MIDMYHELTIGWLVPIKFVYIEIHSLMSGICTDLNCMKATKTPSTVTSMSTGFLFWRHPPGVIELPGGIKPC